MSWKSKTETIINDLLESWGFYKSNHDRWDTNYNYIFSTLLNDVIKGNNDHVEWTKK